MCVERRINHLCTASVTSSIPWNSISYKTADCNLICNINFTYAIRRWILYAEPADAQIIIIDVSASVRIHWIRDSFQLSSVYGKFGSSGHTEKRPREKETCDTPPVSPSRASVVSFAHYFQAPATQAKPGRNWSWCTPTSKREIQKSPHILRSWLQNASMRCKKQLQDVRFK